MNKPKNFFERVALMMATGLGLGYSPFAPGTCGALLGIPLALALSLLDGKTWLQVAIALFLTLLAIPICDAGEKIFQKKDDGRIVADEYMLLPICYIGQGPIWHKLMEGGSATKEAILFIAFSFVISRIVDILKPSPCRQIQRVNGGLGVVLDDLFASIYSWIIIWGLFPFFFK